LCLLSAISVLFPRPPVVVQQVLQGDLFPGSHFYEKISLPLHLLADCA